MRVYNISAGKGTFTNRYGFASFITKLSVGTIENVNILKEGVYVTYKNIKKECEEIWATNKYYVLSKSHKAYLEIREYLKEKEVDILFLTEKIQKVRDMEESKKDFGNAVLHVWGYFKKEASEIEKQALFNILEEYMRGQNNKEAVIEYINTLLKKYPNKYLQESTFLKEEKG